MNRRRFIRAALTLITTPLLPDVAAGGLANDLKERMRIAQEAAEAAHTALRLRTRFWGLCEAAGLVEDECFWDWSEAQPISRRYRSALRHAQTATETAFMTEPRSAADEEIIVKAMDLYETIAPTPFAAQTARDLFTPPRFQSYSHDGLRRWLLTEPDYIFEKSGVPDFLRDLRKFHQQQI